MRILYITNSRLPTERAHGLQIAKTCEALGKIADVTLLLPKRKQTPGLRGLSIEAFYSLKKPLREKKIFSFDLLIGAFPKTPAYYLQTLTFSFSEFLFVLRNRKKFDAFYTREFSSTLVLKFLGLKWFFEAHQFPKTFIGKFFHKRILGKSAGIICISKGLQDKYKKLVKVKSIVADDGVDLAEFSKMKSGGKTILYTGSPYKYKGVFTLAEAAADMGNVIFLGGMKDEESFKELREAAGNAKVLPFVEHKKMLEYIKDAEVLVIPNSAKDEYSKNESSPIKLFEYMASGKKIVASRVPAVTRVLKEDMAWFFEPDSAADLRKVLKKAMREKNTKGVAAKREALKYSWDSRAAKILAFLGFKQD
jgi:glycosyltransferase involved in cell wall biosynthesis